MEIKQWYFVLLEDCFRIFSSHSTRHCLKYFPLCLLNKSPSSLCRSVRLRTFSTLAECFSLPDGDDRSSQASCFLSVQKQEVKSYGAPSREARKRAWLWKWGTGWLARQAENLPTAAWTAIARKESEWGRPRAGVSPCLAGTIFSLSLCAFPGANSHFRECHFHFHWLICCEENFCSPTTEIMGHIWLFMSRKIGLGIKCFALIARR